LKMRPQREKKMSVRMIQGKKRRRVPPKANIMMKKDRIPGDRAAHVRQTGKGDSLFPAGINTAAGTRVR